MSKRRHELNNLLTNLRLSQDILSDYLDSFRRVMEAEPSLKKTPAWDREEIEQKRLEVEDVRKSAASALEKLESFLLTSAD